MKKDDAYSVHDATQRRAMGDTKHDADALRRLARAILECPEPWRIQVVDTGHRRDGWPRYKWRVLDDSTALRSYVAAHGHPVIRM